MAIQMRRGAYVNFNPAKLMPGEWAVVVSGDSNAKDGKAAYICFAAGDVKRVATYEDIVDNVHDAVDQNNGAIIKQITDAANAAAGNANKAASSANKASGTASDAAAAADKAKTEALKAAEEARGSISADKKIYLTYDTVGDTEYLTIVDAEES